MYQHWTRATSATKTTRARAASAPRGAHPPTPLPDWGGAILAWLRRLGMRLTPAPGALATTVPSGGDTAAPGATACCCVSSVPPSPPGTRCPLPSLTPSPGPLSLTHAPAPPLPPGTRCPPPLGLALTYTPLPSTCVLSLTPLPPPLPHPPPRTHLSYPPSRPPRPSAGADCCSPARRARCGAAPTPCGTPAWRLPG